MCVLDRVIRLGWLVSVRRYRFALEVLLIVLLSWFFFLLVYAFFFALCERACRSGFWLARRVVGRADLLGLAAAV
jgi:hypothetical protein